ncbi:MAG: hypothetical protein Q8L78_00030 [Coxiellaceae bacterium]|nr:hypothetical protein [Coxiellaceae bacterium]
MRTTAQQIKALQQKVLLNAAEKAAHAARARLLNENDRSDALIKTKLKGLAEIDPTSPVTASSVVKNAQLPATPTPKATARANRLLALATEADHEIAQAFTLKKLGVSPLFQNKRLLNTQEDGKIRTPAEVFAQRNLSEKAAELLKESMKTSTMSIKDHLEEMMKAQHTAMADIVTINTAFAPDDTLMKSAIAAWNQAPTNDPAAFHKAYLAALKPLEKNNPGLTDPEKNPLLAASLQMNALAEAGETMTAAQKPLLDALSLHTAAEDWQVDPRPAADPTINAPAGQTRLEAALASLNAGIDPHASATTPAQTSLEHEKHTLTEFDVATKALNKAVDALKIALETNQNPSSLDITEKTRTVEKAHLAVAGMLQNAINKDALVKALSEKDLNGTLNELARVRTTLQATTRAKLSSTPATVAEMTAPTTFSKKSPESAMQALITAAAHNQKVFVTTFYMDPITNELKEKAFLDKHGKSVEPTSKELLLAIEKINADIRSSNEAALAAGKHAITKPELKIIQNGPNNFTVQCPDKETNQKFQNLLITLQEKRLEEDAKLLANTNPNAAMRTQQDAIPASASPAVTANAVVVQGAVADGTTPQVIEPPANSTPPQQYP